MERKKIVVVMGGPSSEAEVSRRTGAAILAALKAKGYEAEGMELVPHKFAQEILTKNCGLVFNALHGKYGEDGVIQGTLDLLGIPYTGSDVLAAALTMNKIATKRLLTAAQIPTPQFRDFGPDTAREDIVTVTEKEFSYPLVVKSPTQGSSIGVYIVQNREELETAIQDTLNYGEQILVEEFVKGQELTVAVWGDAAKQEAMPVIEITTLSGRYDYASKYTKGASSHIIPARISSEKQAETQRLAKETFKLCGCRGVARVDMMLGDDGTPYVIEVNSVPGMTETSLVPDAARAMGMEFPELCEHILLLAGYEK